MTLLCHVFEVSRSGYYQSRKRAQSARSRENRELVSQIRIVHKQSRGAYGSPRVARELHARGYPCGENRAARLMRENGIQGARIRRFRPRTTQQAPERAVEPNRLPNWLEESRESCLPRMAWAGDITYIDTQEGWLYLAALLDVEVRKIVGWFAAEHMEESLVEKALHNALRCRDPGAQLLHHSDRGSQYTARGYRALLASQGITVSMSAKGYCYDNAMMESFWATLKRECFGSYLPQTREEARLMIFDYIEGFYNRHRRHSSLGYLSPVDYERKMRYTLN